MWRMRYDTRGIFDFSPRSAVALRACPGCPVMCAALRRRSSLPGTESVSADPAVALDFDLSRRTDPDWPALGSADMSRR
jgi:hypothetical protein